jgi:hypothetical protein
LRVRPPGRARTAAVSFLREHAAYESARSLLGSSPASRPSTASAQAAELEMVGAHVDSQRAQYELAVGALEACAAEALCADDADELARLHAQLEAAIRAALHGQAHSDSAGGPSERSFSRQLERVPI